MRFRHTALKAKGQGQLMQFLVNASSWKWQLQILQVHKLQYVEGAEQHFVNLKGKKNGHLRWCTTDCSLVANAIQSFFSFLNHIHTKSKNNVF